MDFNQIMQTITTIVIAFGLKIIGAIVVWSSDDTSSVWQCAWFQTRWKSSAWTRRSYVTWGPWCP
jgi:hypothetical protein